MKAHFLQACSNFASRAKKKYVFLLTFHGVISFWQKNVDEGALPTEAQMQQRDWLKETTQEAC